MFFLCKWSEFQELLEGRLKREHICLLLLQFGLGALSSDNTLADDCHFLEMVCNSHYVFFISHLG